ncbi:MAG TPA: dihydrolipoamide acetyltransferase family protein [Polyangia bacterium]|jgi:pyruvate dehydrogenase E2 component (dihydrolipoamide acetyltransferase)|nr:dihydrolipoamide acetyltransferase family protein [Polyangia bacterium]
MLYEFRLPDIGEGVAEGEVVRWLVKEGDELQEDQPMVEIMTDKATVEIPTPRAGRVAKLMFAEGQICPVGKVLIAIEVPDAPGAAAPQPAATRVEVAPSASTGEQAPRNNGVNARDAGVLATPATRKLARDTGVDIRDVTGTGPAGRVTSDDVRAHSGSPAPARSTEVGEGDTRIPFRGVRRKIAEHLVFSKHTAAHFTYVEEIDCTDLVALRERANARLAAQASQTSSVGKLSFLPFIVKATAAALVKFPQLNSTLDDAAGEIIQRAHRHIGLATATDVGLIVPVVRDADRLSITELAAEIERLAGLTRAGKAAREELSGSTFTITSLGALGGMLATPIINHPEVAILGVHKIAKRPAVRGDSIVIRDLMNLSISVDHRVVDGYDAARFIAEIKATLESPVSLFPEAA